MQSRALSVSRPQKRRLWLALKIPRREKCPEEAVPIFRSQGSHPPTETTT
jgi:hypothetical protein